MTCGAMLSPVPPRPKIVLVVAAALSLGLLGCRVTLRFDQPDARTDAPGGDRRCVTDQECSSALPRCDPTTGLEVCCSDAELLLHPSSRHGETLKIPDRSVEFFAAQLDRHTACDPCPYLPDHRQTAAPGFVEGTMANDETNRCSNCSRRAVNRRELLMLAGATTGLVVLAGAGSGCGNPTGTPPTGPVAAGNMSALAVGSLLVMTNFVVARDANGVYAMSAVCTHAGCLLDDGVSTIAAGLDCPCHGSTFDGTAR